MSRSRAASRNTIRRYSIGCPVLPLIALAGGGWWVASQLRPVSASHRPVRVTIQQGDGAARIAQKLRRAGLIRNERIFLWYAGRRGDLSRLKAGVYRLTPDLSPDSILDRLKRGAAGDNEITVTIPEGYTVRQISETLARSGVIKDAGAFISVCRRPGTFIRFQFPEPGAGLEGYLFPDTYRFLPNTRPERAAQAMVSEFEKRFYAPHREEVERSGHSLNEIVTIASLIEREAEVPQDRARIAGVIENRLKRRMRLEIDATVLYALGKHKNRVLYRDLEVDSPYNTYRHKGLPPGPIASPGLPSLRAALAPERHAYLYYVASPGRSHVFTSTEAEHQRAVARYRAQRPAGPAQRSE